MLQVRNYTYNHQQKLLSQCCSLSEGLTSLSEQRQEDTDSWRAVANISELFAERRLSEPERTTLVDHLLVASCSPHVR
ncbi:hypothetical protein L195_g059372 [Trifolium pratense]|uniref:Uncharacterized protein n=1 Tax=Trifolium pratense TaxID=57577 RepID=A0A2K3JXU0_TRIPR|nr:hypothetical protein L195_g059372 [Trifolium pratense]